MLVFTNLAAWAQASNDRVISLNGGRNAILRSAPAQPFVPAAPTSSTLVKIYSTLGTGDNVYSKFSGVGILGTNTGQMLPEKVANGFRPKADHIVTQIRVGATNLQGTNVLVVSLNQDNHGIPGKALHTWHFSGLPAFGSCCTLQTGRYATGIPVKQGKLYWVVLRPNSQFQDTWDIWDNNFAGTQGTWANNTGTGWNASYQVLGGFGVFGK
jgi:hypothetical protein